MHIEYETKFRDIVLFNAMHQFLSPLIQGIFILFAIFIFASEPKESGLVVRSIAALTSYVAMWVLQFLFNVAWLYSKKNDSVLTHHTVEIQDGALLEETKFNKSLFYWNGVIKIIRRPGFVAVYVAPHLAHVIPIRAFSSTAQGAEFTALVKQKIHAAKSES